MRLKKQNITQFTFLSVFAFFAVAMNGCDGAYWDKDSSLERARQKDVVVLTTPDPLIYKVHASGDAEGIDHDLVEEFSRFYGLKVKYRVYKNEDAVLAALKNNEGDFAAARLRAPKDEQSFLMGPSYEETRLGLFCLASLKVANVVDLNRRHVVLLKKDNFNGLDLRLAQLAPLAKIEVLTEPRGHEKDLVAKVQNGEADCAVSEESTGRFALRFHPDIEFVSALSEPYSLNWILGPKNRDLWVLMQFWFQQASRNDDITRVIARYKKTITELDKQDLRLFRLAIQDELPLYKKTFVEAAREYHLPWQLLASVAYQESHWNPDAQSFTGVRGIMQLTTETALHLGVDDRTDPHQSIWGGAKYLRYLLRKSPHGVHSKDRLALALASYNIGYANLREAQKIAEGKGLNPNSWIHLREILPQLSKARGLETVAFVERVKSFFSYMSAYN